MRRPPGMPYTTTIRCSTPWKWVYKHLTVCLVGEPPRAAHRHSLIAPLLRHKSALLMHRLKRLFREGTHAGHCLVWMPFRCARAEMMPRGVVTWPGH